jgi:hypothetical protein
VQRVRRPEALHMGVQAVGASSFSAEVSRTIGGSGEETRHRRPWLSHRVARVA